MTYINSVETSTEDKTSAPDTDVTDIKTSQIFPNSYTYYG